MLENQKSGQILGKAEDEQGKEFASLHWHGVPPLLDTHQHHQPCIRPSLHAWWQLIIVS